MVCAGVSNLCANNVQNLTDPVKSVSLYHFITHKNNIINSLAQNTTALRPQYILTGIHRLLIINKQQLIEQKPSIYFD